MLQTAGIGSFAILHQQLVRFSFITEISTMILIHSYRNRFDFLIVCGSIVDLTFSFIGSLFSVNLSMVTMLRIFRVSRLLRLIKSAKSLQTLLKTLLISLPSLANVGTLLILVFFVYAVLGVKLFGLIEYGECLNVHANFEVYITYIRLRPCLTTFLCQSFPIAALTLFRMSTGEDWNCIMHDCMDESKGGTMFAWAFFISFVVLVTFITLNLFIAVILDNFSHISADQKEEEDCTVRYTHTHTNTHAFVQILIVVAFSEEALHAFREAWSFYDPKATRYIDSTDLFSLLTHIEPPLGLGRNGKPIDLYRLVNKLSIPVHEGSKLHFSEVLFSIVQNVVGTEIPTSQLQKDLKKKMLKHMPSLGRDEDFLNVDVYLAVLKAQRSWKKSRRRKKKNMFESSAEEDLQQKEAGTLADVVDHHKRWMNETDGTQAGDASNSRESLTAITESKPVTMAGLNTPDS